MQIRRATKVFYGDCGESGEQNKSWNNVYSRCCEFGRTKVRTDANTSGMARQ